MQTRSLLHELEKTPTPVREIAGDLLNKPKKNRKLQKQLKVKVRESAGKPGSVVDSHSSGTPVARRLKQPTRERCGPHHGSPIRSCSGWGLPCRPCCQVRGALLPHHFTLTSPRITGDFGGIISVALSIGLHRPGVTWHPALRSPDFPLCLRTATVWPTPARAHYTSQMEISSGIFWKNLLAVRPGIG